MTRKKNKIYIYLLLLLSFFIIPLNVKANGYDEGEAVKPYVPGKGVFHVAEDEDYDAKSGSESKAFKEFVGAQKKNGTYKEDELVDLVNQAGAGFNGPGKSLWEDCKKSKYIYWYSSNREWTNEKDADRKFNKGSWYTKGWGLNGDDVEWIWGNTTDKAKLTFERYKSKSTNWNEGKVNIICSYSLDQEEKKTKSLVFKTNSGRFKYDGLEKTVEGLHPDTDVSQLKPSHYYDAVSKVTKKEPGKYTVDFIKLAVYNKDGRDITFSGEYDIETKLGELVIYDEPTPTPTPTPNPDRRTRCVDDRHDEASAYVRNIVTGYGQFSPSGSPSMPSVSRAKDTLAGKIAYRTPLPKEKEKASKWDNWKSQFIAYDPSSTYTEKIDLQYAGVSDILSKHGGVYNIEKTLIKDTYRAVTCQPQEQLYEPDYGSGQGSGMLEYNNFSTIQVQVEQESGFVFEVYNNVKRVGSTIYYEDGYLSLPFPPYYHEIKGGSRTINFNQPGTTVYYFYDNGYKWSDWRNYGERVIKSISGPFREYEDYIYQILSVNCNTSGFQSILGNAENLSSSAGSSLLKTPMVKKAGNSGQLGRTAPTNTNAFYNDGKSCEVFDCISTKLPSARDDSKNNKNNTNNNGIGYFQAEYPDTDSRYRVEYQTTDKNKDYLSFFRDNENNEVRADIWYPKPVNLSGLKSFPGQAASGTLGKLYKGSPEVSLSTIAAWSNPEDKFKKFGEVMMWQGSVNRFIMKSQWSSKENNPYQLGLLWLYSAKGSNKVPKAVSGDDILEMTPEYNYYFEIACPFKNTSGTKKGYISKTPFAIPEVNTTRIWSDVRNSKDYIQTIFMRSVSDTQ